jgi:hypothetical protein
MKTDDIVRELMDEAPDDLLQGQRGDEIEAWIRRAVQAGRELGRDELVLGLSEMKPGETFTAVRNTLRCAADVQAAAATEREATVRYLRKASEYYVMVVPLEKDNAAEVTAYLAERIELGAHL